jgi:hypothetical protein
MTRFRMAWMATAAALLSVLVISPLATGAPKKPAAAPQMIAAITGTAADGSTFSGTLTRARFSAQNGVITLAGTVTGTVRNAAGETVGNVTQQVTTGVVSAAPASSGQSAQSVQSARRLQASKAICAILNLQLQPIDLNLLGLTVHLDTVHLIINAVSGPGNLLGNLLCAVTGLLDGPSAATALANLLNVILARL